MPHPSTIINAYPSDELDNIITSQKIKKIIIYGDFKNMSTGLFVPEVMQEIVYNTENNNRMDSSIFSIGYYSSYFRFWRSSTRLCKNCKDIVCNIPCTTNCRVLFMI